MAKVIRFEDVDYRVIDRKAEVGDLIYYEVDDSVHGISRVVDENFEVDDFYTENGTYVWTAMGDIYEVIEAQTEIITYEGVKYRKVRRDAVVGDLITYNFGGNYSDTPRKVAAVSKGSAQFEPYRDDGEDYETFGYINGAYDVLEEVSEPQPDLHALIANLGRRLHEVEVGLTPRECEEAGPAEPRSDAVNPDHYKRGKYETIEVIEEITAGYSDGFVAHCAGTAIKYIARAPYKHATPLEDLKKSRKYLEFAIKRLEAEASE